MTCADTWNRSIPLIIVYTPAGGEPEHYDATTLRVSEASIVQRTIDMKWQDILRGLETDDLDAMRGIIWAVKKRSNPALRFGEFDPGVGEMTTVMDKREIEAYIDNAFRLGEADPDMTPEDVAGVLLTRLPEAAADPEHARALIEAKAKSPKEDQVKPTETEPETAEGDPSQSQTSTSPEPSTSASSPISSTSPLQPSTS